MILCFCFSSLLSQQLFATQSHRWDFLQWNTLAITRQGLPILWDLHWKCTLSPRATGPPPLFHGYLDTHSPEWRHAAMNPGICDPATDRHSSATDSIKLQIKAGTSKGLWGGSMEMWQWEGERKWVRGGIKKKKKEASFTQSPNVTEPNPNQYLWVVECCYNAGVEHISGRWKHQSGSRDEIMSFISREIIGKIWGSRHTLLLTCRSSRPQ